MFAAIDSGLDEYETFRTLTAASQVLEEVGESHLAARAALTTRLGSSVTDALMAEGAASDPDQLVSEVRAALAAL